MAPSGNWELGEDGTRAAAPARLKGISRPWNERRDWEREIKSILLWSTAAGVG